MKDVLSNLAKLPPSCFAVINGQVVVIRRGARDPAPAVGISREEAGKRNAAGDVTDAQVRAMIAGVTLGWDMDAADPDTQTDEPDQQLGDDTFEYTYQADISVNIVIEAKSEQLAAEEAKLRLTEVCEWLDSADPIPGQVLGYSPSDTLDLIETDDPRP
jgi:hypothetical protein